MAEEERTPSGTIPAQRAGQPGFFAEDSFRHPSGARVAQLESDLAKALEALRSAQHRVAAAETRAETAENGSAAAGMEIKSLRLKLEAIEASHALLLNSKTWKVTEPLRVTINALRRGRKAISRMRFEFPSRAKSKRRTARRRTSHQQHRLDVPTIAALKADTAARGLDTEPDSFVLYRIIGNDHQPRHIAGQSRHNVEFILDNEPNFPACQKRWIVNRIVDVAEEAKIIALLESRGQQFLRIPFDADDYRNAGLDFSRLPPGLLASAEFEKFNEANKARALGAIFRHKNNYLMNNNGARNLALEDGRGRAKWILPFDGNCFLTAEAWGAITRSLHNAPYLKYFIVPMHRVADNAELVEGAAPDQRDEEPQILFRRDAGMTFNAEWPYGRRPKVELLWRLGVPGPWDGWADTAWDLTRPEPSDEAGQYARAGWVARMASGVGAVEKFGTRHFSLRGQLRQSGILATLNAVDARLSARDPQTIFYSPERLSDLRSALPDSESNDGKLAGTIVAAAEVALTRGPYSVTQKPAPGPSGDLHDYFHPAPYWWPNPATADGLPFIRRDGDHRPGTTLFGPGSEIYDRSRLQRMIDDTTTLTLAWAICGERRFATHAARLVATWFLDEPTRMTPHLGFAQVIMGRNENRGGRSGCVEFRDIRYFLDAVRLLEAAGMLGEAQMKALRQWFADYFNWLETSPQGSRERLTRNNHGIHYDLQFAAIAAFQGDRARLAQAVLRGLDRLRTQIAPDGGLPEELRRRDSAHYTAFALIGWLDLIQIGQNTGIIGPRLSDEPFTQLRRALENFFEHMPHHWPESGKAGFDLPRLDNLRAQAAALGLADPPSLAPDALAPVDPYAGIIPYWALTR